MSALRAGVVKDNEYRATVNSMERLNKYAAEKMANFPVNACTDITGFGFLVHACEMLGENYSLLIDFNSLPILLGAMEYAADYFATAAGQRNRNHIAKSVDISALTAAQEEILFDPQTSGGLLISVPMDYAADLCREINKDDPLACIIGQVIAREKQVVIVM